MRPAEWIEHLMTGREIEFHYKEEAFLISYLPETEPLLFSIWSGTKTAKYAAEHWTKCWGMNLMTA